MALPNKPPKVTSFGKDTWWFVPAIANIAAPTVAEINAGFNLACYLLGDQEDLGSNTERVTLPMLLCETVTSESIGGTTRTMPDIGVAYDPQAAAASIGKAGYEQFRAGTTGRFLVRRQGVIAYSASPEAVAGQFVDVLSVETGSITGGKSATGAEGIYVGTVPVGVIDSALNVAVVAG